MHQQHLINIYNINEIKAQTVSTGLWHTGLVHLSCKSSSYNEFGGDPDSGQQHMVLQPLQPPLHVWALLPVVPTTSQGECPPSVKCMNSLLEISLCWESCLQRCNLMCVHYRVRCAPCSQSCCHWRQYGIQRLDVTHIHKHTCTDLHITVD